MSWRRLVVPIDSEMDRLAKEDFLAEGRRLGRLRGSTFAVTLAVAQAVRAGHFTWLNLRTLRQLGGIAARLWVYLEAETYKPTVHGLASTGSAWGALRSPRSAPTATAARGTPAGRSCGRPPGSLFSGSLSGLLHRARRQLCELRHLGAA